MQLTLEQLFGQGARQTIDLLIIQKFSLPKLTLSANNGAEQLLAAIVYQAAQHFQGCLTDEQGRIITDNQGNNIAFDNRLLYDLTLVHYDTYYLLGLIRNTFEYEEFIPE